MLRISSSQWLRHLGRGFIYQLQPKRWSWPESQMQTLVSFASLTRYVGDSIGVLTGDTLNFSKENSYLAGTIFLGSKNQD